MSNRLITILCSVVVMIYAAAFVQNASSPAGLLADARGGPRHTDYLSLWTAGQLAAEGKAVAAYDWQTHDAAIARAMGRETPGLLPFSYPPSFFVVLAPLSQLPFAASMIVFGILSLLMFAAVGARIVGRPEGALWMLATLPVYWNFLVGQSGALAATLIGGGLVLLPTRPLLAGAMFGLLTFKPHLGLLVPVALLAAGQHRAIAAAAASAIALALLSLLMFGLEPWLAFADGLTRFGGFALSPDNQTAFKLQSLYGVLRTIGIASQIALVAQIALALSLAALIWRLWRTPHHVDLKSAHLETAHLKSGILATAAVLSTPYVFQYDLVLLAIGQAFFVRHALVRGLTSQDVMTILLINTLIAMFGLLGVPTGFVASATLLIVLLQRLHQDQPECLPWLSKLDRTPAAST